jgi:hypothetical protein
MSESRDSGPRRALKRAIITSLKTTKRNDAWMWIWGWALGWAEEIMKRERGRGTSIAWGKAD